METGGWDDWDDGLPPCRPLHAGEAALVISKTLDAHEQSVWSG